MKRQRLIPQGSLNRMIEAARESWRKREFDESIELFERASRLAPGNYGLLLELGSAYGKRYRPVDAGRCFEKAIQIAPRNSDVVVKIGAQCQEFGGYEMARHYFERAQREKTAAPETLIKLAGIYERMRLNGDAERIVNDLLQANKGYAPALLAGARLEMQAGRLNEAETMLREALANGDPALRARGWYELGAVLDRLGRYDEAMAAFQEAKALLRPQAAPHLAALRIVRAHIKNLPQSVSREILQRWFDLGAALQPSRRLALLCGHPRSGTTLLEQVLDSHPDIVSVEETTIFHDDAYHPLSRGFAPDAPMFTILESAQPGALQQSRANYFHSVELCLGKPIEGRLLIDKNPSLTFLIPALIRIFPEIKFLVALRDPRDVVLSCFMQSLLLSQVSSAYLDLGDTVNEYVAMMDVWRTVAPLMQNPFLEVRYEDMVEDLEISARRVLNFLGAPWNPCVLKFNEHARQKIVRSPTYADVTRPVFKRAVGRWRNYQKYLEPHLEKLEPFVKAFGYE